MADLKISQLNSIVTVVPATDVLPVVQGGTTLKITPKQILESGSPAVLASATITGALTVSGAANFNGGTLAGYLNGNLMFGSSGNIVNFYAQSSGFAFKDDTGAYNLLTAATTGFVFGDGVGGTRMTLNSTGLGIGVASSGGRLVVRDAGGNDSYFGLGATNDIYLSTGATGSHYFRKAAAAAAMTLDASGNLLVGTTAQVTGEKFSVEAGNVTGALVKTTGGATYSPLYIWNATATGDAYFSVFFTETAANFRGSITYNRAGGLVAYNTTSDYRSKDIIGPVSNSGSIIDSLKVYVGKMKGATIERPMLIAHEAQEVAPYAVTGVKDEVDADGKDKYQQMDVSSFVPLLIAEIQSLRTRVQTLEAR